MIYYKAIKGKTVTTSSTEAELLALSQTAKNFLWWMKFFICLQFDQEPRSTIYRDKIQLSYQKDPEAPDSSEACRHPLEFVATRRQVWKN
jgi:hypothetical protein